MHKIKVLHNQILIIEFWSILIAFLVAFHPEMNKILGVQDT